MAKSSSRMTQLDGLRGLAALAVVFTHNGNPALAWALDLGAVGVKLFFVLSGFLITGILLEARRKADPEGLGCRGVLLAFYARRFLRIFPLYYLVLLACAMVDMPGVRANLPWHVAYLTNFHIGRDGDWGLSLSHFWTLAVEEQFYLLWPTIVLFVPARWLSTIVVSIILIGPLSRACLAVATTNLVTSMTATTSCLDSLGLGALLAMRNASGRRPNLVFLRGLLWAGLIISGTVAAVRFSGVGRSHGTGWVIILTLKDLGYSLVFAWLVSLAAEGFTGVSGLLLAWRPLVYTGTISYGIYVYHEILPYLWHSRTWTLPGDGASRFLIVMAATYLVAALSWALYERPLNNLKDRFPYFGPAGRGRDPRVSPLQPCESSS
ncbi:acyltransferase family protein [Paludisphaera rhizosphaerae]|uniref:acyltransferase family protein n=1 Tax=Paludisphaera rhizosphaerae TaxID=2711216 RepID=UPI0013EAE5CB|nr:acyltransferase [Paludisphaera rhizosphaerae]